MEEQRSLLPLIPAVLYFMTDSYLFYSFQIKSVMIIHQKAFHYSIHEK